MSSPPRMTPLYVLTLDFEKWRQTYIHTYIQSHNYMLVRCCLPVVQIVNLMIFRGLSWYGRDDFDLWPSQNKLYKCVTNISLIALTLKKKNKKNTTGATSYCMFVGSSPINH